MDYAKSGQPVPVDRIPKLKFRVKPDWNAPETVITEVNNKRYYKSTRAIGKLYRDIDLPVVETIHHVQQSQRKRLREGLQTTLDNILEEFDNDDIYADNNPMHLWSSESLGLYHWGGTKTSSSLKFGNYIAIMSHNYRLSALTTRCLASEEPCLWKKKRL